MKRIVLLIVICNLLIICSTIAFACDEFGLNCDVSYDSGTDWSDSESWDDNFNSYPDEAFSHDSGQAWNEIYNDNSLMQDPVIRAAAFADDPVKSSAVLNLHPEYMDDPAVLADFDAALISAGEQDVLDQREDPEKSDTQSRMLNKNPAAKEKWMKDSFGIDMSDSSVVLRDYTGDSITSEGENGLSFDPKAAASIPGDVWVDKDGSLRNENAYFNGGEISLDDNGVAVYKGGTMDVQQGNKEGFIVVVEGGKVNGYRERVYGTDSRPLYTGSFTYIIDENGNEHLNGNINLDSEGVTIQGEMYSPKDSYFSDFVLVGETTLIQHADNTQISVNGKEVYYTQTNYRSAGKFCEEGYSCIVNTPGSGGSVDYRERLSIIGVSNGDMIEIKSPVFYSHLEVIDLQEGSVSFSSVNAEGGVLGKMTVGQGDDITIQGNDLSKMKAGRIDVQYEEGINTILHHWSSNDYQKDEGYFSERNSMVSCTVNVDCEQTLAQSFGKVIKDGDAEPKTTVVFSGDNVYTARNMESWCKNNGGCYILNSRDLPAITNSENLVVTGHHWSESNYVWRDSEDVNIPGGDEHNPIDKVYFGGLKGSSPYDQLPQGDSVETVTFSACNTVWGNGNTGLKELDSYYDNLEQVQGWDGTAPLHENVGDLGKDFDEVADARPLTYSNSKGITSTRAYYYKEGDTWSYTNDGNSCQKIGSNIVVECNPAVADGS